MWQLNSTQSGGSNPVTLYYSNLVAKICQHTFKISVFYRDVFTFTIFCANMYWFNYQYMCLICINPQLLGKLKISIWWWPPSSHLLTYVNKLKISNIFVCHLVLTFKVWQNVLLNLSWTGSNSFFELDHIVTSVSRKKMYQLLHKNRQNMCTAVQSS